MATLQLTLQASKDNVDAWSDALLEAGAVAVTLEEDVNQPVYELTPGHSPLWDNMNLLALFPADTDIDNIKLLLANNIDQTILATSSWQIIADTDWQLKWQESLQPMLFGNKLWICPSWCAIPDPTAINIILDPEMAFGTGSHPTTALCLEWITENITPGDVVIDYGCGSGILGIAAAKFGASKIYGVDIDPVALEVSNNNALKNNVSSEQFSTYLPEQMPAIKADLVIANILANPLLDLMPVLADLVKPNGQIILSGLLVEQAALIKESYSTYFGDFESAQQGEWLRIVAKRR